MNQHNFLTSAKIATVLQLFLISSCFRGPGFWNAKSASGKISNIDAFAHPDGSISGTFHAGSSVTQALKIASGSLQGTELAFPPGSLSIDVNITVTEGQSLAATGVISEVGMKNAGRVTARSASVAVISDTTVNTSKPFSLSIPIADAGTQLALSDDPYKFLVVIYKVSDASRDGNRIGFIPRSEFTVSDGKAIVTTTRFGLFQLAETDVVESEAYETDTTQKILTSAEENALPEAKFSLPVVDSANLITASLSGADASSCRIQASTDKENVCDSAAAEVSGSSLYFSIDDHKDSTSESDSCKSADGTTSIYFSFTCLLVDGRFVESGWSDVHQFKSENSDTVTKAIAVTSINDGDYLQFDDLAAYEVAGTCSPSGSIVITLGTSQTFGTCDGENFSRTIDISSVSDGIYTLTVDLLNEDGDVNATTSLQVIMDKSTPSVSLDASTNLIGSSIYATAANWSAFAVNGTCTATAGDVEIYYGDSYFSATCNGTWSASLDVSSELAGEYSLVAYQTTPAGIEGSSSSYTVLHGMQLYGTGADGDISPNYGSPGTQSFSNLQNASSHYIYGFARVTQSSDCTTTPGLCTFTLNSSAFISVYNVVAGTEIMWIVHGSVGSTSNSCASSVGTYGFGIVSSVNTSDLTIARTTSSIPPSFGTPVSGEQCVLQIIRVPQINSLTVTPSGSAGGTTVSEAGFDWDGTSIVSGTGGVLVMRIKGTLNLGSSSSTNLVFSMSGKGFRPGDSSITQGLSELGAGTTATSANGAGGGGSSFGGGGGGAGYAAGADGNPVGSGGGLGGQARSVLSDSSMVDGLLPVRLYFGGGGGAAASTNSGYGGGIVLIFADSVGTDGSGALSLLASGASGTSSTDSGGGGGGGSIVFYSEDLQRSLSLTALGGDSPAGVDQGGGGGGGYVYSLNGGSGTLTTAADGGNGLGGLALSGVLDSWNW